MSRPVAVILKLLLSLALFLALAPAVSALNGPKISFEKTEVILPNLKEGQKVTARFPFINKGDMNLVIDQVSPSCGCTVPSFTRVTPPGKKGEVSLELDSTGITGAFRKQAVVSCNDSSNPFVTLVLLGETQSRVKSDKGRRLELMGCLGKELVTSTILSDPDGSPLLITSVQNPMADYLDATLKALPGGKSYRLTIKSKITQPMRFAGPLFLNLPNGAKVSLFVVVDVKGAYAVQPHIVFFGGLLKGGPAITRSIQVEKACTDKLVLENLVYNRDYFDVKTIWTEPGKKMFFDVTPRQDKMPKGPFNEKMIIMASKWTFKVVLSGTVQ